MDVSVIKKQAVPILKKAGVTRSAVFGSAARGDSERESDIDILVELPFGATLFDLVGLQEELETQLHRKVDLVTYKSIHRRFKPSIERDAVRIL